MIQQFLFVIQGIATEKTLVTYPDQGLRRSRAVYRYYLDLSKLEKLGWQVSVEWEEGLRRTIAWFEEYGETWFPNDIQGALKAHPGKGNPTAVNDAAHTLQST